MSRRGKVSRRPAEVPTGLLDAYTESSSTASTALSDSDKFKQGYVKKKDKGKTHGQMVLHMKVATAMVVNMATVS